MLDLFNPLEEKKVAEIVAKHTPSRVHSLDAWKRTPPPHVIGTGEKKRLSRKTHLERRIVRQEQIMATIQTHARDTYLTVEQIGYYCGMNSEEQLQGDLQNLFERGFLSRQKVRNRARKNVWAYWVKK